MPKRRFQKTQNPIIRKTLLIPTVYNKWVKDLRKWAQKHKNMPFLAKMTYMANTLTNFNFRPNIFFLHDLDFVSNQQNYVLLGEIQHFI